VRAKGRLYDMARLYQQRVEDERGCLVQSPCNKHCLFRCGWLFGLYLFRIASLSHSPTGRILGQ